MGVLYDYFRAADAGAAVRLMESTGGSTVRDGQSLVGDLVEAKGIDPMVVVGQLVAFIRDVAWTPDLMGDRPVWPADPDESEDGPWVVQIGDPARDALAGVSDADRPGLATRWARIEEFGHDPFEPDDLLPLLGEMVELARRARDADERLFCWMCL